MNKIEIETRLNELKDCKMIKIITQEGMMFEVPYENIINNTKQEYIFVDAPFEQDKNMFLYCSIKEILPV